MGRSFPYKNLRTNIENPRRNIEKPKKNNLKRIFPYFSLVFLCFDPRFCFKTLCSFYGPINRPAHTPAQTGGEGGKLLRTKLDHPPLRRPRQQRKQLLVHVADLRKPRWTPHLQTTSNREPGGQKCPDHFKQITW